jgi:hypothetical protein
VIGNQSRGSVPQNQTSPIPGYEKWFRAVATTWTSMMDEPVVDQWLIIPRVVRVPVLSRESSTPTTLLSPIKWLSRLLWHTLHLDLCGLTQDQAFFRKLEDYYRDRLYLPDYISLMSLDYKYYHKY